MTTVTLLIEPAQEARILSALRKGKGCRIKVRKPINDNEESPMSLSTAQNARHPSKGMLVLTASQMKRYRKAPAGSTVALPFKHEHLQQNMHCKGGFLPLLAALLAPIIGGVAGGLIEKEIAGSGVHLPKVVWRKRSGVFQVDPAPQGQGLHLSPWRHTRPSGFGLYLSPYPHKHGAAIETEKQLKGFSTEQKEAILNLM